MDTADQLQLLFGSILRQIPMLTIEFIGLWFALARRAELGRAGTFAVWGFSSLIAYAVVSITVQHLLVIERVGEPNFVSNSERVFLLGLWNLAAYVLYVVGLASLARAVFVGRKVSGNQDMDPQPTSNAV